MAEGFGMEDARRADEEMFDFFKLFFKNNMLKFFSDLFNHVLKETEDIDSTPRYDDLPMVFPVYQNNVGSAVLQVLQVSGPHIEEFFSSIRERIHNTKNVKTFISRLGAKFLLDGKAPDTLYFLTVSSRIFALANKTGILKPEDYLQGCVEALEKTQSGPKALSGFRDLLPLIANILSNENWKEEFRNFTCGDVDYYFPTETDADNNV